uniref:Uncharacterized protein n=1 Tax=Macrostomum lignano TaxID=282301 RepID=A0A1I8FCM8_9PLAT
RYSTSYAHVATLPDAHVALLPDCFTSLLYQIASRRYSTRCITSLLYQRLNVALTSMLTSLLYQQASRSYLSQMLTSLLYQRLTLAALPDAQPREGSAALAMPLTRPILLHHAHRSLCPTLVKLRPSPTALSIVSKLKTTTSVLLSTVDQLFFAASVDFIACGCYPQPQVESRLLASQSPSPRGRIPRCHSNSGNARRGYASAGLSESAFAEDANAPTRRHRMTAVAGGRNDSDGLTVETEAAAKDTCVLAPQRATLVQPREPHKPPVSGGSSFSTPLASVAKVNSGLSNQIQEKSPKQPLTTDDKPRRSSTGSVAQGSDSQIPRANAAGPSLRNENQMSQSAAPVQLVKSKLRRIVVVPQSSRQGILAALASNSAGVKSR